MLKAYFAQKRAQQTPPPAEVVLEQPSSMPPPDAVAPAPEVAPVAIPPVSDVRFCVIYDQDTGYLLRILKATGRFQALKFTMHKTPKGVKIAGDLLDTDTDGNDQDAALAQVPPVPVSGHAAIGEALPVVYHTADDAPWDDSGIQRPNYCSLRLTYDQEAGYALTTLEATGFFQGKEFFTGKMPKGIFVGDQDMANKMAKAMAAADPPPSAYGYSAMSSYRGSSYGESDGQCGYGSSYSSSSSSDDRYYGEDGIDEVAGYFLTNEARERTIAAMDPPRGSSATGGGGDYGCYGGSDYGGSDYGGGECGDGASFFW